MSGVPCRFCTHHNPGGSRFCNACGSPLHLKPCRACEAINETLADRCYQCGEPFGPDDSLSLDIGGASSVDGTSADAPRVAEMSAEMVSAADPSSAAERLAETAGHIPVALAVRFPAGAEPMARSAPREAAHGRSRSSEPVRANANDDHTQSVPEVVDHPRRVTLAAQRKPSSYGPILAIVAICAIAAGGYYAYVEQTRVESSDGSRDVATETSQRPAAPASTPVAEPDANDAAARGPTASSPNPPTPEQSSTTRALGNGAVVQVDEPAGLPRRDDARATMNPDRAVEEAKRSIARDKSADAEARDRRIRAQIDRDALATQRLIARDLAGFPSAPGAGDNIKPPASP